MQTKTTTVEKIQELMDRDEAMFPFMGTRCPICNNMDLHGERGLHYPFCPICGQRLKWRNQEDVD